MAAIRILFLAFFAFILSSTSLLSQTRTEVANIGDDNQSTIYGPTYAGTLSLLTNYHFETLFLSNEINLSADGELNAIEFYVTGGLDLDLLGSATIYLKTTSQSSLSNGSISDPESEGYVEIEGSFSLLGLGLSNGDIVRFELDEGFPVDQGENIALHTRQNIAVGASLGASFYASGAENLIRAGTTSALLPPTNPTMEVRSVRPNVRLEFETQALASAANSVIRAGQPEIFASDLATTLVVLEVRSETGEIINSGGDTVQFSTSLGTISSANDNGDGTYTATLTASNTPGTATITATLNGQTVGDQATVNFVETLSDLFCTGLTEETVRIGNLTSSVTPRGPLYTNTVSLTLGTYQFETLFLQNEFNVDTPGFLESIVFFTDNAIDVDLLEGAQFYIRETSQTSLNEGNVSLDDYTFVGDGSSLVNINIDGNNAVRINFETPLFYSGNGNIAFHSRHFALADVNLGGQFNFDTANEQLTIASGDLIDLLGLGITVGLTSPEFTNQRPVAELEFDMFSTASLSESTLSADPDRIPADGASTSTITSFIRTADGMACELQAGNLPEFITTAGSLSNVNHEGSGEYTALLTSSTVAEFADITANIDGLFLEEEAEVEFFLDPVPSPEFTTIEADPTQIAADGSSSSTITVTLRDENDEPFTEGGFDVDLSTTAGTLGDITDNGDGTYTAILTSSTEEETATITGTLEGEDIEDSAEVNFVLDALPPSPDFTIIEANPTSILADGSSTSEITVTLRDENDDPVTTGGFDVELATTAGSLGDITDNGDGTYTATLTSSTEEEIATITGTLEGVDIADDAEVEFFLPQPSPEFTTITANPTSIDADGESTSAITVTLRDENDEPVTRGGFDIELFTTAGTLSSVTDNGDGTYTATLTSSTEEETATITGTLEGVDIADDAEVEFFLPQPSPEFTTITANPTSI
ncbi:MAG: hypothetical protein JJU37_13285, partial [Balneolaceae bacterium]|nr:hypothetical protein [Balneolaceae bacterium]